MSALRLSFDHALIFFFSFFFYDFFYDMSFCVRGCFVLILVQVSGFLGRVGLWVGDASMVLVSRGSLLGLGFRPGFARQSLPTFPRTIESE